MRASKLTVNGCVSGFQSGPEISYVHRTGQFLNGLVTY